MSEKHLIATKRFPFIIVDVIRGKCLAMLGVFPLPLWMSMGENVGQPLGIFPLQ